MKHEIRNPQPAPEPQEIIYWEDDFEGAVAQIVRIGEQMSDGQAERFELRMAQEIDALKAENERLKDLILSIECQEWVKGDDDANVRNCIRYCRDWKVHQAAVAILARREEKP